METHLAAPDVAQPRLMFEHEAGRVIALCGVTCGRDVIVLKDPSCTWCARKEEEREHEGRMRRIG